MSESIRIDFADLTSESATSYFLFGAATPQQALYDRVRSPGDTGVTLEFDAFDYLQTAGRFAAFSEFAIVEAFFATDPEFFGLEGEGFQLELETGRSYSFIELENEILDVISSAVISASPNAPLSNFATRFANE